MVQPLVPPASMAVSLVEPLLPVHPISDSMEAVVVVVRHKAEQAKSVAMPFVARPAAGPGRAKAMGFMLRVVRVGSVVTAPKPDTVLMAHQDFVVPAAAEAAAILPRLAVRTAA